MVKFIYNGVMGCTVTLGLLLLIALPAASAEKPALRIAYLPILDHLTLPIAYELSDKGKFEHLTLQPVKYTSWTELVDAVITGKVDGAFMLVPLGMHLRQKGTPIKLVLLGHRNGSALVVSPTTKSIEGLRGGLLAIPHPFSMQHINLYKYLVEKGRLRKEDFTILDMEPPDMAPSLARGEIDGFLVAQPFPTLAEVADTGRIMAYSCEIWEGHVDCALFLLESVLVANHDRVGELIKVLVDAGKFIESNPRKAARLAVPYIGLDEEIIYKCLTNPPRGITYNKLVPRMEELEEVQGYLIRMGLFEKEMSLKELIDDSFVRAVHEEGQGTRE
ncbi:MAG TPA: ABC transporter substrate-binding protein [Candidatus Tripitaka californicus]|uniref:ABC transporter substrate-binding protein n=1 Tax=Candidatus Tripitaka californicus TaxID=3367616 RepID=UPI004028BCE9|nr:ABC transporter substrate-binding protein [Planctomycetota bacterium]